nr:hypothetical protein [Brucella intermedia]
MIAFFVAAALLVTPEQEANAISIAARQNDITAAHKCVAKKSLKFARYTNETAEAASKFAVQACAIEIAHVYQTTKETLSFMRGLEHTYALEIVQWRAEASEYGEPEQYKKIGEKLRETYGD